MSAWKHVHQQNTNVEQAHLCPWDKCVRPRCQRMSASRRRDRGCHQQGADNAQEARHRLLPEGGRLLSRSGRKASRVDLVVRNCYVLPVEDLELRLVSQYVPEVMDEEERKQAKNNPLYLSNSNKVVTVSHHLAHAYSAFAACPFDKGVVMVVDGVGNYSSDIAEPGQLTENVNPLARESESYYRFDGARIE